jgi:hypothetical protein
MIRKDVVYCIAGKFGGLASTSENKKYWQILIWRIAEFELATPQICCLRVRS